MIAVIDSGVANLASVTAALHRLKADVEVTADAAKISAASHVVLPGVGAAGAAMMHLRAKELIDVIRALTQPVLGICLGMQLLFTRSEEGNEKCLGVIEGDVRRMQATPELPVPHMGWNRIEARQPGHPLLRGVMAGSFVYFVHSFAVPVAGCTVASSSYGDDFTAIVAQGNFLGCQFHPERSSAVGSQILENFLSM